MEARIKVKRHIYHLVKANHLKSEYCSDIIEGMTSRQQLELLARLKVIDKKRKGDTDKSIRKARSLVLDVLTRLGIYTSGDSWERVNSYLMNPRIANKLMYEMSLHELNALHIKLRSILNKQKKKQVKEQLSALVN